MFRFFLSGYRRNSRCISPVLKMRISGAFNSSGYSYEEEDLLICGAGILHTQLSAMNLHTAAADIAGLF